MTNTTMLNLPNSRAVRWVEHVVSMALASLALIRTVRILKTQGVDGLVKVAIGSLLGAAKSLPGAKDLVDGVVDGVIDAEIEKIRKSMLGEGDANVQTSLPKEGRDSKELARIGTELYEKEKATSGKRWAGIYHSLEDTPLSQLQGHMWKTYHNTNGLYPSVFKNSLRKMEAETISMTLSTLSPTPETVGLLTSGGSESILIAVHTYRELARERGIQFPEIIGCLTAHGALDKGCHYFGIKLIKLKADAKQQLNAKDVEKAITPNTIAVYASAPTFPHGIIDPIEELSALAQRTKIGLHVDNCLGGFYLCFLQRAGRLTERQWDFSLPGVTTISVDLHKYGFAPKGNSVLAFKNPELRRLSYVPVESLVLYITPTLQGSRPGASIAGAWATLMYMGESRYKAAALQLQSTLDRVQKEITDNFPELYLIVKPDCAIVAFGSDSLNIFAVSSQMEGRGWSTFSCQGPPCMSFCVGECHTREVVDTWMNDLRDSVDFVKENPNMKVEGSAGVYGAAGALPTEIMGEIMKRYVDVTLSLPKSRAI